VHRWKERGEFWRLASFPIGDCPGIMYNIDVVRPTVPRNPGITLNTTSAKTETRNCWWFWRVRYTSTVIYAFRPWVSRSILTMLCCERGVMSASLLAFSKLEVWDLLGGEGQLGELIQFIPRRWARQDVVGAELRHTLQSDNGTE
jgi:hypothetical protein